MRKVGIISQFAVRSGLSRLRNLYRKIFSYPFKLYNRFRLKNKNLSIISKDCVGGVIMHDLGLRFDTPTVNLWFNASDFIKFCRDMKYYITENLREDHNSEMNYPVGLLGRNDRQIKIYFMHYDSFAQAREKWYERISRIHWDNLYIIMTDREGCDEEQAREFDALPYEHKALLTYRDFQDIKSSVKLDSCGVVSNDSEPPNVLSYPSAYSFRRIIDHWDYVSFLNS